MDLPTNLIDTTTLIPNHSVYGHFFCILIRCLVALFYLMDYDNHYKKLHTLFLGVFVALTVFFVYKYYTTKTWKVYARSVLTLVLVLVLLQVVPNDRGKTVAGTLLIVDAMMGLQSRYIATLLKTM